MGTRERLIVLPAAHDNSRIAKVDALGILYIHAEAISLISEELRGA